MLFGNPKNATFHSSFREDSLKKPAHSYNIIFYSQQRKKPPENIMVTGKKKSPSTFH